MLTVRLRCEATGALSARVKAVPMSFFTAHASAFKLVAKYAVCSFLILSAAAFFFVRSKLERHLSPATLPTEDFLVLPGSASSIAILGKDVYITHLMEPEEPREYKGAAFHPDSVKKSRLVKLPLNDFLSRKGRPQVLAEVGGSIASACLSHDQKSLYFIIKDAAHVDLAAKKSFLCRFDIASQTIADKEPCDIGCNRLLDLEGKYLLQYDDPYRYSPHYAIAASRKDSAQWAPLLPENSRPPAAIYWDWFPWTSVFFGDKGVYCLQDKRIYHISKESILDGSLSLQHIYTLPDDIGAKTLFVDESASLYAVYYNNRVPFIFDVQNNSSQLLGGHNGVDSTLNNGVFFKQDNVFYGFIWYAYPVGIRDNREDTVIVRAEGGIVQTTATFPGPPSFLGPIGDYLVFNRNLGSGDRTTLFGIKYK